MKTHREQYPEQYSHPLVGKKVRVRTRNSNRIEGEVKRVMNTSWGKLVDLGTTDEEGNQLAYGLWDCEEIQDA
jgi:hypothetical protein